MAAMMFLFFRTVEKKVLDKFEGYWETTSKRQEEGYSEEVVLNELCQASLGNFPSENFANEDEGSGSLGKTKRKRTAIINESLDQANDQDMTKKKRTGSKGKENVSWD